MLSDDELAGRLRAAARTGERVRLDKGAIVPASALREELVATDDTEPRRWIELRDVTVEGELDLDAATLTCGLRAFGTTFTDEIVLREATSPPLALVRCTLPGLSAQGLRVRGRLNLSGTHVAKIVDLNGARIDWELLLAETIIDGSDRDRGFSGDNLRVGGSIAAHDLVCRSTMSLRGADVAGQCRFQGAQLTGRPALAAERLKVGNHLLLDERFSACGQVNLTGADIKGQVGIEDATFTAAADDESGGIALSGAQIGEGLYLHRLSIKGELALAGAYVLGDVELRGGTFTGRPAINAPRLRVRDGLWCTESPVIDGKADLGGALIGGDLHLEGVEVTAGPDGFALFLDGARIERDAFLNDAAVRGCVSLSDAFVGGKLSMVGATVTSCEQPAVLAAGARIDALSFDQATLRNPAGSAVNLQRASIADELRLTFREVQGMVDLGDVTVTRIVDTAKAWPKQLELKGLVYDRVDADPKVKVKRRLKWIARQKGGYAPGPYRALATSYRAAGQEEDARKTLIASRRARRRKLGRLRRVWDWSLDKGLAYGYKPQRAAYGLALLLALGTVVFGMAYPEHFEQQHDRVDAFHAFFYALDVLVPVVELGQRAAWAPEGYALWVSGFMTFAGWLLTTSVAAALSGLLRPESSRS